MKKLIVSVMAMTSIAMAEANNPLTGTFDTPHGTTPFSKIELEHYMPALDEALAMARAEIAAIVNNPAEPDFSNTIEALERHGQLLDRVTTIFFVLNSSETSDEMDRLANEMMPKLTEYSNDISLDPALFERVRKVYDNRASLDLDTEQQMLLEKTYKSFSRNGAALSDEAKEKFRAISTELSGLTLLFGQNVLGATNAFSLNIPVQDAHKVEYMPEFVKESMAAEAKAKGQTGWTVTLQAPSMGPFMTYSNERDLKEQVWMANGTKCNVDGEFDNRDNVRRIAELRLEMARLLGYETFADYVLEERMAKSSTTVEAFLNELLVNTIEWAHDDFNKIRDYASTLQESPKEFMPWDYAYYEELYKKERYDLDDEQLKPYFRLENVEAGVFELATRLYGITFRESSDIDVYNPDVKVFEVFDNDGSFLSVLYMDYFPRESKRGGAWMTAFREMRTEADGTEVRPHISLNFNFTKPTGETPSLLTFYEVVTFLHEFGHGLHGMFAEGKYQSLTGTNVYRDFVELPSQLMENWATEKEFLDLWAVHYQTGEKIPAELVEKIIALKNYMAAYMNVRQLSFGINDMAWHSITSAVTEEPVAFEKRVTAATQILPSIEGAGITPSFTHIFAGGYAAGYYGYKWAEVLEADAFSLFQEKGIFDKEVAGSFRRNILSKGGTEHPMTLYIRFRGHEPQTRALIDKIGEGR